MRLHRWILVLAILWPAPPLLAQEEVQAILDEVPTYQKVVEEIRGEAFKKDVKASIQSMEDFKRFVEKSMKKDLPPALLEGWELALQKLGLVEREFDLVNSLKDFTETQAGAYYDPETEAFYVVMTNVPPEAVRMMAIHELQHALQDQLFDLDKMMDEAQDSKNSDRASAISFLVEGEATVVMTLDMFKQMGMDPAAIPPGTLEMSFSIARKMNLQDMGMEGLGGPGGMGGDTEEALKALEGMPSIIVRSFIDPYTWGAYAIAKVYGKAGWSGVSDLFRDPPQSTELLLHPEKLLGGEDPPVPVELPEIADLLGPGWEKVHDDTFGEHGFLCLLDECLADPERGKAERGEGPGALMNAGPTPGEQAAAGWGGDRLAVYDRPGGATALVWATTWDSEEDAREFFDAYVKAMRAKLGPTTSIDRGEDGFREVIGSDLETENIFGILRGRDVLLLHAPVDVDGPRVLDRIAASRKGDR